MTRPIDDLIRALNAGDPLTKADAQRLNRHLDQLDRISETLEANRSPEDVARAQNADESALFDDYRRNILRQLDTYSVPELRELVCELLAFAGAYVARHAATEGRTHRSRTHKQKGGQRSGQTRRSAATSVFASLDEMKARDSTLTDAAAARRYLRQHDPNWQIGTDEERERKVERLTRSVRRFRKKKRSRT